MVAKALTDKAKDKWMQSIPSNPPVIIHEGVSVEEKTSTKISNNEKPKSSSS
jgi:hypothetical protein